MPFNVEALATVNLVAQALLLIAVLIAARLARKKRLIKHCRIITVVLVIELVTIFLVMLPSLVGLLNTPIPTALKVEDWVHHSLGLVVVLLWVYVSLAVRGRVRAVGKLAIYMRAALAIWVLTFLLGVHLYFQFYVLS